MFSKIKDYLVRTDYWLLFFAVSLAILGIVSVYSAGYDSSTKTIEPYYLKQITWFILGIVTFFVVSFIGYRRFVRFAIVLYILGILLLVVVLAMGKTGMGAQRWISVGSFAIQPSEIFKFTWVVMLGWLFMDFKDKSVKLLEIAKKALFLVAPFLLIFLQPDLGTSLTFIAVFAIVVIFLGITRATLIISLVLLSFALPFTWTHMHDYQKKRVTTFLNPESDPFGSGYHIIQSKIGVGSGGYTGKGFLNGTQSHLKFIPERHTDFIFTVVCEEFGFFGAMVLVSFFVILIVKIFIIGTRQKEPSGKIICVGVAGFLFLQFVVNSYMVLGMMPVVGIPMPFVSYGGSSLVTFFAMLGLVNSVHLKRFKEDE